MNGFRVDTTIPLPWLVGAGVAIVAGWFGLSYQVQSVNQRLDTVSSQLAEMKAAQTITRDDVSTLKGDVNNQRIDTTWARKDVDDVKQRLSRLEQTR